MKAPLDPDCDPASKRKRVNITVRCSLKELAACIKLSKSHHLNILETGGLGHLRHFNIESNICRPLIFFLMHRIDPATMTLDLPQLSELGESSLSEEIELIPVHIPIV